MRTTSEKLGQLQKNPENIRNICILAHVDHGKTTLADSLVASNGIISQRLSGKIRYMDSREDEQLRGITMKSSAISLHYAQGENDFLINVIDSPGHVDFSSEVSTAVRLCDGAIILVDVVEGVSPQTHAVLRQAWLEGIKPVLMLNKIDRLITEIHMEPFQAYLHLQQILEQVNVLTSELFTSTLMEKTSEVHSNSTDETDSQDLKTQTHDWSIGFEEESDDSHIYFSPDQGNVIFSSALDGWGFSISHFAQLYSEKLGISSSVLKKTLWGNYYLNPKTKRIMKGAQAKAKKPLFVQFVLENLWAVYNAVVIKRDKEMTEKITKSLNLKITARDSRSDPKVHLQAICSQWLPLSNAVLGMVAEKLPSPINMCEERIEKLMCSNSRNFDSLPKKSQDLKKDFLACSSTEDVPVIIFVSKMVPVERKLLPQNKPSPLTEAQLQEKRRQVLQRRAEKLNAGENNWEKLEENPKKNSQENDEKEAESKNQVEEIDLSEPVFVAFARIFSGTVRKGCKLYVLGPKHDPAKVLNENKETCTTSDNLTVGELPAGQHITSFQVEDLYMFMGRELELMEEVPAGNVLGLGGLENHILKTATLSETVACPAFTDMHFEASPIVRVALEPQNITNMPLLVKGLRLLNQADPCVEVRIQETGEHVIIAAGEVHLRRCIDDLTERYAKCAINASSPIVPFRETIIEPPKTDMVNEAIMQTNMVKTSKMRDMEEDEEVIEAGLVELRTPNRKCRIRIRAKPLPESVIKILEDHPDVLKALQVYIKKEASGVKSSANEEDSIDRTVAESITNLRKQLEDAFTAAGKEWHGFTNQIWSFGPRYVGCNLLINNIADYDRPSVWNYAEGKVGSLRNFDHSIISGFQMATLAGPLCEEPMHGVCFCIEEWDYESSVANGCLSENISHSEASTNGSVLVSERNGTEEQESGFGKEVAYGPFSGQLMSTIKEGCRKVFQTQPQRLMAAMYKCNIQATADVLGKLYAVLGKRNGRVIFEDMREGTQVFIIQAVLPIIDSFGFAEDIRKKTSGLASPQLKFSHWEVVDVDPFWEPVTDEEYLHFGEKADSVNLAWTYMNTVRKRKGLKVDEKIVEHAEKQRTLKKNK